MSLRRDIRLALDGKHPRLGRSIEFFLLGLIVASAIAMGVETVPDLPEGARSLLARFEVFVIAAFGSEYLLRLAVSERPGRYATSFYGVIDLLSFLPALIGALMAGSFLDGRALRTLRLFRLLRLLKFARYTDAAERLREAWRLVREEVIVFGVVALVVLYVCALIIYQFEHEAQPDAYSSVFTAMWWAAVTLTTVGYGDLYPITAMGRIFTVVMLFVALGIIAIPTGLVASAMSELRKRRATAAGEKQAAASHGDKRSDPT